MSALLAPASLGAVMPPPSAAGKNLGRSPLDLIPKEVRTIHRDHCPKSFGMTGIWHHSGHLRKTGENFPGVGVPGRWAVVVEVPCQQWSCKVCGERKAQHFAGIARAGCALSTERLRLLTISCPKETSAKSWEDLGGRWDKLSKRLARRLRSAGRSWSYFATVELQRRGNPHLHVLMRDSGYVPKSVIHALAHSVGFGFSDIRQIAPGAGVVYVTKYLHKSAGQVLPKGARRVRRSRDWFTPPLRPTCSWGPEWAWQSVEGLALEQVERELVGAGYEVLSYVQRPDDAE